VNRTGHRGRVDLNHAAIINGLRQAGIAAHSIASVGDGLPDILAGFRGVCMVLEVKRYKEGPTEAEREFASRWPGPYAIVTSPNEAVEAVLEHARSCGRV